MIIKMLVVLAGVAMSNEEIRQEVVCAETSFSRAAESRDRELFLSFVDPDARFITSRVARGRDGVGDAWSRVLSPDGPLMRWRPAFVEVTSDGNLAISRGPYRSLRTADNGEIVETWGHFISTWRRAASGRWQVVFDTGGDVGMTPTDAERAVLAQEPECPPVEP